MGRCAGCDLSRGCGNPHARPDKESRGKAAGIRPALPSRTTIARPNTRALALACDRVLTRRQHARAAEPVKKLMDGHEDRQAAQPIMELAVEKTSVPLCTKVTTGQRWASGPSSLSAEKCRFSGRPPHQALELAHVDDLHPAHLTDYPRASSGSHASGTLLASTALPALLSAYSASR